MGINYQKFKLIIWNHDFKDFSLIVCLLIAIGINGVQQGCAG